MEKKGKSAGISPGESIGTLNISSTITLAEKKVDDDYDPFEHRESSNQYSDFGALAHLLKGSLGSGILAMPMAFMHGGLIFGTIGTVVIGIMCTHCVHILVQSAQTLCKRTRTPALGMAETAAAAFQSGPQTCRPFASAARIFVTAALFCTYYFGLTAYVVFIASSLQQVIDHYAGVSELEAVTYKRLYIGLLVLLLIPLGLIRKLKHLVPFSLIANVCIIIGFSITVYYLFAELHSPSERNYGTSLKGLPIFFATVLFAMEGIGTVMPIENTMRNPKNLGGWSGILSIAMATVVFLFTGMGFLGYLRFGNLTEGSVTLNLDTKEIPAQVVKVLLAVTILFTYPLQFYVPCEIMWNVLEPKVRTSLHNACQNFMRVLLVIGTVVVSLLVPNLGPIISLVGALFFSILGLFIPAVVETVTLWEDGLGRFNWILWKNGFLVLLSQFSVLAGTYVSILDIMKEYGPQE